VENRIVLEGEWLTAKQAMGRLGLSHARFYRLVKAGRLTFQEVPGGRLYPGPAVDRLRTELDASPWNKSDNPGDTEKSA
jgi:hypothetical protein